MARSAVPVPIRFRDIDCSGHGSHARYLTGCEDHRTVTLARKGRDTGLGLLKTGFDDRNVAEWCAVEALGTSSARLYDQLETAGDGAAWVRETLVLGAAVRPRALTDTERKWMSQFAIQAAGARSG
jgi:hypothetical protein